MKAALLGLLLPASLLAGCCRMFDSGEEGCRKDTDCKGERVCVAGQCAEPPPGPKQAQNPPGEPPPRIAVPPPPQEPAAPPPAQPAPPPRPAAESVCAQDGMEEIPCPLGGNRVGWCKRGKCINVCPGGLSYNPLDTQCHARCGAGSSCKNCMDGYCMDSASPMTP